MSEMKSENSSQENQADVNASDNSGNTNLHYAAATGNIESVRYLLDRYTAQIAVPEAETEQTPLHSSAPTGSFDMVRFLLTHGANVDVASEDEAETPAPSTGNAQIAELLHDFQTPPATENDEMPGLLNDFTQSPVTPPAPVQPAISAPPPTVSLFGGPPASPMDEVLDDDIPELENDDTPAFPPSDKSSDSAPAA